MLRHVALFHWKPQATAEDVSKIEAALHLDEEGLRTYANHPDHQAILNQLIRPITANREAIQYVIDHKD